MCLSHMGSNNNNKRSCISSNSRCKIMAFKRRSALAKPRNFQTNYSTSTVLHRGTGKGTARSSVVNASAAREVQGLKLQLELGLSLTVKLIKVILQTAFESQSKITRSSKLYFTNALPMMLIQDQRAKWRSCIRWKRSDQRSRQHFSQAETIPI